ncbi:MAG: prepilin-type N-terminal cleavage/methylation domain-containing protein [Clostridiales bacterium]|nr:prepilin-type N-terminal cleavage/methylation domain-containing protein [Clostridiales bacterium]
MKIKNTSHRGVTLIELIIVITLIAIVIAGAFSIFTFGNKTFKGASNQFDLQTDVRFALDALTSDVRYATTLQVLDSSDFDIANLNVKDANGIYVNIGPYDTYIYYDDTLKSVVKISRETYNSFSVKPDADLKFSLVGSPASRINFELTASNTADGKEFEVSSEILMLNIIRADNSSGASGVSNGVGIKYVSPESYISELQFPVTQLIGTNDDQEVEITFDKDVKLVNFSVSPGKTNNSLTASHVLITPGVGSATMSFLIEFKHLGGNPTSFVDNDRITLILTFGSSDEYQAVYDLLYVGGGTKAWIIE